MKKKLVFASLLVLASFTLYSCSNTCKTCKEVTYESGVYVSETGGTEYCGAELLSIEATPDVNIGSTSTRWECN